MFQKSMYLFLTALQVFTRKMLLLVCFPQTKINMKFEWIVLKRVYPCDSNGIIHVSKGSVRCPLRASGNSESLPSHLDTPSPGQGTGTHLETGCTPLQCRTSQCSLNITVKPKWEFYGTKEFKKTLFETLFAVELLFITRFENLLLLIEV